MSEPVPSQRPAEVLRPWLRHRSTACARNNHADPCSCGLDAALASLAATPEPTPCRHAIYNHGCPSCDERDPESPPDRESQAQLAAAEKIMGPILLVWFALGCGPHDVEYHAENAAVDLSWALQTAGLLASPATSDVIAELCANVDRLRAERDEARRKADPNPVPDGCVRMSNGNLYRVAFEVRGQPLPDGGRFPLPVDLYRLIPYRPEKEAPDGR